MPFYIITLKGVPGFRLVEADKPQQARDHVIADMIEVKRVENRELIDAAKQVEPEVAGLPQAHPETEKQEEAGNAGGSEGDNAPEHDEDEIPVADLN